MFYTMLNSMIMLAIVMSIGYYLQKKDILNDEVRNKLTYILLSICMPSTFFMALQLDNTKELFKAALTIIALSFFLHFFFLILAYLVTKILKIKKESAGIVIFSLAFKNLSYIGLPVVSSLYVDENPSFYVTLFCIAFNILAFSLGPLMLSKESGVKIKLSNFMTNINISVLLGFSFFIFGIKVPKPIGSSLNTISQLTIPLSLLLTGALLTKTDFKAILKDTKIIVISLINLIVLPILFLLVLVPLNIDPFLKEFSYIMSLLPSASMTLILADKYDGDVDMAGKLVLTSTVLSLVTAVLISSFPSILFS